MFRSNYIFILVLFTILSSCKNRDRNKESFVKTSITDCGCDSLWAKPVTKEFVSHFEKTTATDHPIWEAYKLGDGVFVLNAGQTNDSTHCLGLWKNGKSVSFKCSKDIPKMLTPLYSYYLNYKNTKERDATLFGTYENSPEFSSWMEKNNVEIAVYMPTEFPKFPFKIPAKMKTQLAIHEAFHIEVMLRYWYTKKGFWPEWDKQPDRAGVQNCYTENETTLKLIDEEQHLLSLLIEALLDNQKSEAFALGNKFIETRETRYNLVSENEIKLHDNTIGDCRTAEAIMEIEEGIADYASWVKMYEIDMVSRKDLLQRYRAKQKDRFYLTGAMLLHASVLMNNISEKELIKKIVLAKSLEEGNLFHIFKEQLILFNER